MSPAGWIGVWLLIVSAAAIVVEAVLAGLWGRRVALRARSVSEQLATSQALVEEDLARLRSSLEEMQRLWRPYRRVLRWLRHPLVIALMQSYARRRAAAP